MGDGVEAKPSFWIEESNGEPLPRLSMKRKARSKRMRFIGWGSEQLIEFLQSIGEDTNKQLSQYDVTDIINKYVNVNSLSDPNKKKKINCDEKLYSLFGRKTIVRVRIHDMLESHFAENQEESPDNFSCSSEDEHAGRANGQKNIWSSERKTPYEKKVLEAPKSIFAAIVPDNLKLVYLKKSLVQKLLKDPETVEGKLVGSFVRVKSDPNDYYQKNSHQLLQVTGLKKTSQTNSTSTGTNCMSSEITLQASNYVKDICVSMLSDDNFSQEECEDLHQRVKDGLLRRPMIVELEAKAQILHEDITRHWLVGELALLQKRIDRANEKGWRREYPFIIYLERRQVLQSPDEQTRLLSEVPKVIADCSEAEVVTPDVPDAVEQRNDRSAKPAVLTGACEISTSNVAVATAGTLSTKMYFSMDPGETEVVTPDFPDAIEQRNNGSAKLAVLTGACEISTSNVATAGTFSTKMYFSTDPGEDLHAPAQVERKLSTESISESNDDIELQKQQPESKIKMDSKVQPVDIENGSNGVINREVIELSDDEESADSHCNGQNLEQDMTSELWHYLDPQGDIQGPFALSSLRRWSEANYFPPDFKIWKSGQTQHKAVLLRDIL
ncbi:hypothetical protein HS088_TW07G00679 [Tripterygium wilfordii]|uniref:Uncharacterized protein n=1 Tax=Tripterygium wilfordii TaxID=458696 RepID=A0A7J7DFQ2_TRIWF|nr:hypothetical protein HS088_TW07G00679 [Tripterygium wilfordii]